MNDLVENKKSLNFGRGLKKFFYDQTILVIFIVIVIIISIASPNFLRISNIFNVIRQITVLGIMACGMTIVVIGKGMDLSSASILALAAVVNVMLQQFGYWPAAIAGVLVAVACGFINGFIIGKIKANFIIVTLGTQILFTSLALIISQGRNLSSRPEKIFCYIADEKLLGIPVIAWILIIIMIIVGILLQKTIPGRRLYATGLNDKAALVAGINVSNIITSTYVINGFLIGIASVVLCSRLPRIRVGTAADYLFDVITVVVLGGTSLSGGIGNIYKTAIGLLLFAVINNAMALLTVPFEFQQLTRGIILIIAVVYDEFNRRKRVLY
ncbi:MAG: ABC transporter permease [Actinobacteria bacterium]|nr:ABC transporter permease [Cyanobacteriota bacterium]MCL5771320.1 ABC transporter permease [Actinomycetota bacterium]